MRQAGMHWSEAHPAGNREARLVRALDRMFLRPDQIPRRLIRQLFELDADYAEHPKVWTSHPES